ncbi:muscle M-line assembly protein unc-89 [Triplophysa dalaica]|uniref:muscle M-line assembly protein unc-89 n=1 Tax=Triplophysa dalaica TaxID=1582913 RepID=UPI0024DF6118|nr:muscle M-line assembly protein unc-89 [Triplophysa dalaica]
MSSKDTNPSQEALISLIYRHLKDNGYKKAANVLRKDEPQVKNKEVKASLSEIFKKWASEETGERLTGDVESDASESSDISPWPPDVQTPELSPGLSRKKPVNRNVRKTSGSKKLTKKETVKKSKKAKKSGLENGGLKILTAAVSGSSESDSDSSLDVEKWRKLVSQLSDADVAKMEVLSNFVESPVSLPEASTGKRGKTKLTISAKNEKSRTTAKKTTSKTDDISVKTDTTKTSSKKSKDKATASLSKVPKAISKSAGDKSKTSKSSKRTKAKHSKSEKVETHEPAVNQETNGLLETDEVFTTSEGIKVDSHNKSTKKAAGKSNCLSEQIMIPGDDVAENVETSSSQTSSKKAKKKKRQAGAADHKTPSDDNGLSDTKVKKNKKASKPAEAFCQDANLKTTDAHLTSDRSETPSKKAKKSSSKSVVELVLCETKKLKTKKTKDPPDLDTATSQTAEVLQESSNIDSPSKKQKPYQSESLAEDSETPSKKVKKAKNVIAEPDQLETPLKKPKKVSADTNPTKVSLKKRSEDLETQPEVSSETELIKSQTKSRKSQVKSGDGDDGMGNEEASSQDLKTPSKKRKHKREEANDVIVAPEETTPEPKKNKKKKKEAEDVAEDVQQPSDEAPDTVASSQKKKKKKREKETESEETVPDDPEESVAAEEVIVQKKKKSSKKRLGQDEVPELDDTDQ